MGRPILLHTLESLLETDGAQDLEIFVVGRITDQKVLNAIREIVSAHKQIHHLEVSFETGDSSRKKNAGAEASHGDVIAFLDDDVVVDSKWPVYMREAFADPSVGLASGPSLIPDDISLIGRLAGLTLSSRAAGYVADRYKQGGDPSVRPIPWSRLIGCNMAYRREAFQKMGGFDPAFWPGEEMIASYQTVQMGFKLVFVPLAHVYHYPRQSLRKFWKQMYGYGATRIRLIRGGVEFEPTTIVPALWVASLLVLGVGSFFSRWFVYGLLLDLLLYCAVAAFITTETVLQTRKLKDALIALMIPVMHLSYGLAEWLEFFFPNKDLSEGHLR